MLSNKLEYLARKNRKFLSKKVVTKAQRKKFRRVASTARRLDTLLLNALIFRRRNQRTRPGKQASTQGSSESRSRKA